MHHYLSIRACAAVPVGEGTSSSTWQLAGHNDSCTNTSLTSLHTHAYMQYSALKKLTRHRQNYKT